MRILHFSDIHISLGLGRIPVRDWPGKRLAGGVNFLRGRGRRFERALEKLDRLTDFANSGEVDLVVFSGDFTAMGTRAEFATARAAIQPFVTSPAEFVCVAGNHDLYTRTVVRERRFEKTFEGLLETDLPDSRADGPWPIVRLLGDDVAVVALNSAKPNPVPWRSSGRVPQRQLEALHAILRRPEMEGRFVFIVTHYAPCLSDGRPDTPAHGLENAEEFLQACAGVARGAILCGHVHETYRVRLPGVGPEVFCAGRATMHELEGFWMYDVEGGHLSAQRGSWTGHGYEVGSLA
ncbi:MAG: metallophosphoesterase family protein [Planctomycetota bacterium]